MSDQYDAGTVSSLEELFLSREFGQPEQVRTPIRLDEIWLHAAFEPDPPAEGGQLEEVFLSRDFGHPQADELDGDDDAAVADQDGPGATVLAFAPRDAAARQRAVAAIGGVAAAALVVAGVASGIGHPNSTGPSSQAQGPAPHAASGNPSQPTTAPSVPVTAPPANGSSSTVPSSGGEPTAQLTAATSPAPAQEIVIEAPPGSTVTVTPPPSSGASGGSPAPAPTSGSGNLLSAVVVVVGNTVHGVGTAVTTTSGQLGATVPAISPLTGVLGGVGATVSGVGQALATTST
jgi:hypothetical protein